MQSFRFYTILCDEYGVQWNYKLQRVLEQRRYQAHSLIFKFIYRKNLYIFFSAKSSAAASGFGILFFLYAPLLLLTVSELSVDDPSTFPYRYRLACDFENWPLQFLDPFGFQTFRWRLLVAIKENILNVTDEKKGRKRPLYTLSNIECFSLSSN